MNNDDRSLTAKDLSPQDQAKHAQIEGKVQQLHASIGQPYETNGERVSARLLSEMKAGTRDGKPDAGDRYVLGAHLSEANSHVRQGEFVMAEVAKRPDAIQGDPANEIVRVRSADAIKTPTEVSFAQVIDYDRAQQVNPQQNQQLNRNQSDLEQSSPSKGTRSLLG